MYAKIFATMFQGTLRGKPDEILVFVNLLATADRTGIADKHPKAIADEVGLSLDKVLLALIKLEELDPESRNPEEGGARLVRLDAHRSWGWRIVSYLKYRGIRDEDDRREQNRRAAESYRNKQKETVSHNQPCKPKSAHAEAEADAEADVEESPPTGDSSNGSLFARLPADAGAPLPDLAEKAFQLFNEAARRSGWPQVQRQSKPRRMAILARIREAGGLEGWKAALEKAEASDFLCGRSEKTDDHANWRLSIDFLLKAGKFAKIMEGGYDNSDKPKRRSKLAKAFAGIDASSAARRERIARGGEPEVAPSGQHSIFGHIGRVEGED